MANKTYNFQGIEIPIVALTNSDYTLQRLLKLYKEQHKAGNMEKCNELLKSIRALDRSRTRFGNGYVEVEGYTGGKKDIKNIIAETVDDVRELGLTQ